MIKMKSIEKAYGDKIVLDNVNLEIKPGKFYSLLSDLTVPVNQLFFKHL